MATVYLNGDYIPAEQASISVLDRGVLYADSIYEVIPAYHGKLFALAEHIERLNASCQALRIHLPIPVSQWQQILETLIQHHEPDAPSHRLYIQITRGKLDSLDQRSLAQASSITPTIIAQCTPMQAPDKAIISKGQHVITHQDIRRLDCHIKSTSLMANVIIQQEVTDQGAHEAILIRDGYVTEGNSSNVFLVKNGQLLTPKLNKHLLGGITRQLLIDIARDNDIPVLEIPVPENQLTQADEIWISSSTREIVPITKLNKQTIPFNPDTSLWHTMIDLYRERISQTH